MILLPRRPCSPRVASRTGLVLAVALLVSAVPGFAQEAAPQQAQATVQAAPQPPPLRPIDPTEIADSAVATRAVLREAARAVASTQNLADISQGLAAETGHIDALERETQRRMKVTGPSFALEQTEHAWQRLDERLEGWLRTLSSNAASVASVLDRIGSQQALWEMTRDSTRAGDVPAEVTREIRGALAAVDSVQDIVRAARDTVLQLQAAVGEQKTRADQSLADQRAEIARRRGDLLSFDSAPVWRMFRAEAAGESRAARAAATWRLNYRSLTWFVEQQGSKLLWSLVLPLLLVLALFRLRGVVGAQVQEDDSLRPVAALLGRPVAAGLFIAGVAEYMAQPSAPRTWRGLLALVVLVSGLWLVRPILKKPSRWWGYTAAGLFFLLQAVNLTAFGTPTNRVALFLLAAGGLWASLRLAGSESLQGSLDGKWWAGALEFGLRASSVAFAIALIGNIVGTVGFATVLATGTMHLAFATLAFWLLAAVVLSAVRVGTMTKTASRVGIDSSHALIVQRSARRLVPTLAVVGWSSTVLSGFGVLDPVVGALTRLLSAGVSMGGFSLTLGAVLAFGIVIWLAFELSQLISFVLATDLLPLMDLPHGAPAAITQLTRYAVILVGVLVALSVAGVDVDNLTVLFGALGVGVGFGLQNVVGNLASGLVLLFGRLVNLGDEVQFDDFEGVVRGIGLLQSTVRTYHGADVLVPNSTLVSSTLVNWTHEGARQRRVDIPVGVVYGTDPQTVIDLLEGVAAKHALVARRPAPKALFLDFGENSLDFQLNAWFPEDKWYGGSSELRVAANEALVGAGIEVACPQRDLHLRSVDDGVSIEVTSSPK